MLTSFFIACISGVVIASAAFITYIILSRKRKYTKEVFRQSEILKEQLEYVFKLTTLEIQFSQIHKHEDKKDFFFGLFQSTKRALVIVNAKALIGFDFSKSVFEIDTVNKCLKFKEIPNPEVLGLDTDYEFYDIKEGIFNKFRKEDLNQVLDSSKNDIRKKCLTESSIQKANRQLSTALTYLTRIVDWKLELPYSINQTQPAKIVSQEKMIE